MPQIVTKQNLPSMCEKLAAKDEGLASILERHGIPPLWDREPSYATLVHIILEQQVSLASALAALNKLKERIGVITPENVLALSDSEMKACYFSRQKKGYVRDLAEAIIDGRLQLESLGDLNDGDVKLELKKIKGIGNWTAEIYLLMALRRPDIMPRGDIALYAAYKDIMDLPVRPTANEFDDNATKWKPYRSVAARLLWHYYLSK